MVISVLFLRETLTAQKVLGIGVVLLGAAIILLRGRLNPETERGEKKSERNNDRLQNNE